MTYKTLIIAGLAGILLAAPGAEACMRSRCRLSSLCHIKRFRSCKLTPCAPRCPGEPPTRANNVENFYVVFTREDGVILYDSHHKTLADAANRARRIGRPGAFYQEFTAAVDDQTIKYRQGPRH
jgi:hypothetical protein